MREDAEISRVPTDRAANAGGSQRVPVRPSPQTQALNAPLREQWIDDQRLAGHDRLHQPGACDAYATRPSSPTLDETGIKAMAAVRACHLCR